MTTATADKMYKELSSLAEVQEWFTARQQTPEEMWPVEKRVYGKGWKPCYRMNALAPIYGNFWITIESEGRGKWVVFHEEGGEDQFEKSYPTLKAATAAAREFAEFFYACYVENVDGQEDWI